MLWLSWARHLTAEAPRHEENPPINLTLSRGYFARISGVLRDLFPLDKDGCHPFDLTGAVEPDDRYVVVATGRDYDDVKPISGIYSGTGPSEMTVTVEVTRLA